LAALPDHLAGETTWEREQHAAIARRWGIDPLDDVDRVLDRLSATYPSTNSSI